MAGKAKATVIRGLRWGWGRCTDIIQNIWERARVPACICSTTSGLRSFALGPPMQKCTRWVDSLHVHFRVFPSLQIPILSTLSNTHLSNARYPGRGCIVNRTSQSSSWRWGHRTCYDGAKCWWKWTYSNAEKEKQYTSAFECKVFSRRRFTCPSTPEGRACLCRDRENPLSAMCPWGSLMDRWTCHADRSAHVILGMVFQRHHHSTHRNCTWPGCRKPSCPRIASVLWWCQKDIQQGLCRPHAHILCESDAQTLILHCTYCFVVYASET